MQMDADKVLVDAINREDLDFLEKIFRKDYDALICTAFELRKRHIVEYFLYDPGLLDRINWAFADHYDLPIDNWQYCVEHDFSKVDFAKLHYIFNGVIPTEELKEKLKSADNEKINLLIPETSDEEDSSEEDEFDKDIVREIAKSFDTSNYKRLNEIIKEKPNNTFYIISQIYTNSDIDAYNQIRSSIQDTEFVKLLDWLFSKTGGKTNISFCKENFMGIDDAYSYYVIKKMRNESG